MPRALQEGVQGIGATQHSEICAAERHLSSLRRAQRSNVADGHDLYYDSKTTTTLLVEEKCVGLSLTTGPVFTQLRDGIVCGACRYVHTPLLPQRPAIFSTLDGVSFDILIEDGFGNCFTTALDGTVWFWDHETHSLTRVASSVSEFVFHCIDPEPVELDPDQVESVWIDPAFASSLYLFSFLRPYSMPEEAMQITIRSER